MLYYESILKICTTLLKQVANILFIIKNYLEVPLYLLLFSAILLLALFAIRIAKESGIPALLLFLILGILFKYLGLEFNNFSLADHIANIALMIIMFYGGFGTKWSMTKPVAAPAITLATLGVVITSLVTGLFAYYFLHFSFYEAMLLGSVVGSTDFASVSNILASKKLNLKFKTAPLLEMESGSNDPTAYTLTMVFLALLLKQNISIPWLIFRQICFGAVFGFAFGYLFMRIIKKMKLTEDGLFSVFIAAVMLGTYAITDFVGGNGYLALYILGIYIGNNEFHHKRDVIFFYDGVTQLVEIILFFLLGLLSQPHKILENLPLGFVLMLFLLIVARPFSVFLLLRKFKTTGKQNLLISMAGIRGAAAIAFAIMAVNTGATLSIDLFHLVFAICLFSALIQGTLLPTCTRLLAMYDPIDSVLRTFNSYQIKSDFNFIVTTIKEGNAWIDKTISELNPQFNFIIAKIERNGETIIPRGDVKIEFGDKVIMGGEAYFDHSGEELIEIQLAADHGWVGQKIKYLPLENEQLIIMILRNEQEIITPNGETELLSGDRLVMLEKYRT